ncbi:Nramp family divalent metal transporter [Allorhodopirellula heiligendammensis]|uniref:Divalent metal cation transporter MntH n=1 Tax=Allorhodopirellula heiligendammensis TaxID=2714739 RepID=A0A5C6C148_9BACT|nr:Nramp family divalent metal transporter [Allorhodopirellula heiligendammensis]TWU18303.1 Divalent metal cation transporter MntH [Allorhodopirellula heiligendammensis]
MSENSKAVADHPVAWYRRIGPGLITACVVIGPGSIMTSSTVGANYRYSMLWVVVVSVTFMLVYMTMAAKLGAVSSVSPCDLIRRKAGRPLAILVGFIVFFICSAFQSSNNTGVVAAFEAFVDSKPLVVALVVTFNAIAIMFLFLFKNLYKVMERLMMFFVAVMLISFAINLLVLRPDPVAMAKGFIPSAGTIDLALLALIGTTFVIAGAFYQAYLVQQKGWDVQQVRTGILDARVGAVIMALITIILMSTAAAGLYTGSPVTLADPVAVAEALEPTFGTSCKVIFCLGLFCAAYSSFLVNSMVGGFIASDGLGLGSGSHDRWPRIMTTLVLLSGMTVSLAALVLDFDRTPTIIMAQAVTVVGAPLVAIVLLWLASSKDVMGDQVNGPVTKTIAGIGLVVLLAMAANTALVSIPSKVRQYRETLSKTTMQAAPATSQILETDQR